VSQALVDAKRVASNGANGVPNTKPATTGPSDIAAPSSRPPMEKPLTVQIANVIGDVLQFAFEDGPEIGADVSGLTDGVEAVKAAIDSANALSEGDNSRAVESGAKAGGTLLAAALLGKLDKIGDAVRGLRGAVDHVVLGKSLGLENRAAQIGGRHLMGSQN